MSKRLAGILITILAAAAMALAICGLVGNPALACKSEILADAPGAEPSRG